jgi:hypothetical protein
MTPKLWSMTVMAAMIVAAALPLSAGASAAQRWYWSPERANKVLACTSGHGLCQMRLPKGCRAKAGAKPCAAIQAGSVCRGTGRSIPSDLADVDLFATFRCRIQVSSWTPARTASLQKAAADALAAYQQAKVSGDQSQIDAALQAVLDARVKLADYQNEGTVSRARVPLVVIGRHTCALTWRAHIWTITLRP